LALGPTANWPRKAWAADRFADIARRLTGSGGILPGGRVAVLGGPDERDAAKPAIDALPGCIDLVGRVDLLTAYACLKRCAFYVGNDSGLMHLAAAACIPTLGLFGPSKEELYAPWGPLAAAVRTPLRYDELLLSEPGYDRFAPGSLMNGLTVDTVERAARDLWQRTRANN
jgi:ADP-heptose:LPS heptosyltransferase